MAFQLRSCPGHDSLQLAYFRARRLPRPSHIVTGKAGELTVVWGRNRAEGSLRYACDTGLYATVILSFLRVSGGPATASTRPTSATTSPPSAPTSSTARSPTSSLCSSPLIAATTPRPLPGMSPTTSGTPSSAAPAGVRLPFGDDAVLDDVDFYLDDGVEQERFSDLVRRRLQATCNSNGGGNKAVRLTATPPCSRVLNADMGGDELGLFERLHVRFYGEARCGYDYHETRPFWGAWHIWSSRFPAARLLVGLPATDGMRGWIDPATLRDSVLPSVQDDPSYGGLMLWDRYHDKITGYSRAIDP